MKETLSMLGKVVGVILGVPAHLFGVTCILIGYCFNSVANALVRTGAWLVNVEIIEDD